MTPTGLSIIAALSGACAENSPRYVLAIRTIPTVMQAIQKRLTQILCQPRPSSDLSPRAHSHQNRHRLAVPLFLSPTLPVVALCLPVLLTVALCHRVPETKLFLLFCLIYFKRVFLLKAMSFLRSWSKSLRELNRIQLPISRHPASSLAIHVNLRTQIL